MDHTGLRRPLVVRVIQGFLFFIFSCVPVKLHLLKREAQSLLIFTVYHFVKLSQNPGLLSSFSILFPFYFIA